MKKIKLLALIAISGMFAASIATATPITDDGMGGDNNMNDNVGALQGPQLADNGMGNNGTSSSVSGAPSSGMSGSVGNMSGTPSNNMSGTPGSNMSGTPGSNMSGTPNNNMGGMSGSASPSDEGGADTATGDDY